MSTDLIWTIGLTEKKIEDENVSWDSDKKETKLTLSPPPTETREYGCFYVGAETNSTATVQVLGRNSSLDMQRLKPIFFNGLIFS